MCNKHSRGSNDPQTPRQPDAPRRMCAPGGFAFFAYLTNDMVDVQAGIIVDVEAVAQTCVERCSRGAQYQALASVGS